MQIKNIIFSAFLFIPTLAYSDDCMPYKLKPTINLTSPQWVKQVVQPLQEMDLLHGDVIATMNDNYDIVADITNIEDGFCVAIKEIDADVGYSDFLVQIDIRHNPNTCSHDAILAHEDEHIRAYLSVMDDFNSELKNSIYNAANSIMPVFVHSESEIDSAIDQLNKKLQSHPELILVKQKINAAQEIRNKRVDQLDDGTSLKKCFE